MRMYRRIIGIFCIITLLMTGVIYRIYYINMSDYLTAAADLQGQYLLKIATTRGMIYDRNMEGLVNNEHRYVASVLPTPQAASALTALVAEEERVALMDRMTAGAPFAMEVESGELYAGGVDVFRVPERYGQIQYAPHLIGYLSGDDSSGAAGIERAYDAWLAQTGEEIAMYYQVDATGRVLTGASASVSRKGGAGEGGVVLSLDRNIQLITQDALASVCDKGAAVVLDAYSGDILAMASLPAFDPNDIASSLNSEDAPFINRAISGYNIGSVFKLLVAAGALESGISTGYTHYCEGGIEVDGRLFRCNNSAVHGEVDMRRALQVSCNAYFISLAQEIPPEYLISLARNMGLDTQSELAEGLYTQKGNLPEPAELQNAMAYANFSFGQGSSLASPLQMAQAVSAIVNSGFAVSPRLVLGATEDGVRLAEPATAYASNQVIRESTANTLRRLMVDVVEDGSGRTGKPATGGAGGKTSSAQTGIADEEGNEIVHAWFAGFYPAEQPKYSIVIFVEGGESGENVAAPAFKRIADGIASLTAGAGIPLGFSAG